MASILPLPCFLLNFLIIFITYRQGGQKAYVTTTMRGGFHMPWSWASLQTTTSEDKGPRARVRLWRKHLVHGHTQTPSHILYLIE